MLENQQNEPAAPTTAGAQAFQALFSAAGDAIEQAVEAMERDEPGVRAELADAMARGLRLRILVDCSPAALTAELHLAAADGSTTRLFAFNVPRTAPKTN